MLHLKAMKKFDSIQIKVHKHKKKDLFDRDKGDIWTATLLCSL